MTPEKRTRSKSRGRKQPSPSSNEFHRSKSPNMKTTGMIFGDLEPVPYDKRIDPPPHACYNCWKFDHKRKSCTKSVTYVYCCNCGRSGMTVKNCPRCFRTYQKLRPDLKVWIDTNFNFNLEADNRKQTTKVDERRCNDKIWDGKYDKDEYQNYINSDNEKSKYNEAKSKSKEQNDDDFGWEPVKSYHSLSTVFAEPNNLFTYLRAQKIRDEFDNDVMNNVAVNLNETRLADKDSYKESSILSNSDFFNFFKKDEEVLRSTGEPLQDMLNLLTAMKHLPVETQNIVILQYISEKKKQAVEDKVQSTKKMKSP